MRWLKHHGIVVIKDTSNDIADFGLYEAVLPYKLTNGVFLR